jgi:hypothetical protein
VLTTAQAAQVSEQLTARLGVAATRDAVAAVPVDQLVAAVTARTPFGGRGRDHALHLGPVRGQRRSRLAARHDGPPGR